MLVSSGSWSLIILCLCLNTLASSLVPGQGCQVLSGQERKMCTACSLYNQCSTFMEAAVSLLKVGGVLGYAFSPDGGAVSVLAWGDLFERLTMFDALAPFHPTALGIITNLPKIEQADDTMRKKSFLHAWYSMLVAVYPKSENLLSLLNTAMLMNLGNQGLDNVNSTDMSTPEGIGNFVGDSVATFAKKDGMNVMGDMNGKKYNLKTFSDYTGYSPVNSVNHVSNPRLWQPDFAKSAPGFYSSQMFVTPQLALVKPFSVSSVERYNVSPPGRLGSWEQYRRDTDEVIASMAGLTAEKKAISEYFNDKLMIVRSLLSVLYKRGHEFYIFYLKLTIAINDAMVAVWKEKTRYNMVRPFTAVRYLYANHTLAAYSKEAGKVVDDMSGSDWDSFIPTADHPEYPSATAAYCGAVAELMRLETGSDDTDRFEWIVSRNSSFQEEAQPPEDITLAFPTWTDWETQCGLSRVWAGTHFVDAVTEGRALGRQFAKPAKDFVDFHVNGQNIYV